MAAPRVTRWLRVIAVLTVASVWLFRSAHPDDDQPAADDTDPSRQ